jgi:hypothetical protein
MSAGVARDRSRGPAKLADAQTPRCERPSEFRQTLLGGSGAAGEALATLRGLLLAILRRSGRRQPGKQCPGRRGDLLDGMVEGLLIRLRRLRRTADLAHVLQRRVLDLVLARGWLEVMQGSDVSTHVTQRSGSAYLGGVHARAKVSAFAIAVLAALLIVAAPAHGAAAHDGWGFAVADDDWEWDNPGYLPSLEGEFAALEPKAFRFQMIWNAADLPWHIDRARGLIARARAHGVEQIVVTFKRSVAPDLDPVYGAKPTAEGYAEHVSEVVRLLADDVDVWGPANEPNRGEMWLPGVSGAQLLAGYYAGLQDAIATWDPTAEITSPDFVDRSDLGTIAAYVNAYENAGGGWGDHVAFHPYAGAYNETTRGRRLRQRPARDRGLRDVAERHGLVARDDPGGAASGRADPLLPHAREPRCRLGHRPAERRR